MYFTQKSGLSESADSATSISSRHGGTAINFLTVKYISTLRN